MTPVDCPHWSAANVIGGGVCALGKFGGRPSLGTCDTCMGLPARPPSPELVALFQVNVISRAKTEGPKRWAALHSRALAWDGGDPAAELAYVAALADGLGLCSCRRDWLALLARMPPDLSSPETYWRWSIDAHNEVNMRLGKPLYSPLTSVPL